MIRLFLVPSRKFKSFLPSNHDYFHCRSFSFDYGHPERPHNTRNIVFDCKGVKHPVAGGKMSLINIITFYHFYHHLCTFLALHFTSRKADYNKALLHLITVRSK